MFIQNIAKKNTQTENKILYSHTDNKIFVKMLRKIFNAERVGIIDESAFANKGIDLIICNNRLELFETCISLAGYLHCPLMIVDHKLRPEHVHISMITKPAITHFKVALNKQIAESWMECDAVLGTDISNPKHIESWKNTIEDVIKQTYKVSNYEEKYSDIN